MYIPVQLKRLGVNTCISPTRTVPPALNTDTLAPLLRDRLVNNVFVTGQQVCTCCIYNVCMYSGYVVYTMLQCICVCMLYIQCTCMCSMYVVYTIYVQCVCCIYNVCTVCMLYQELMGSWLYIQCMYVVYTIRSI